MKFNESGKRHVFCYFRLLIKVNIYNHDTGTLIAYDEAGDRIGFRYSVVNVDDEEYPNEFFKETSLKLNHVRFVGEYGVDEVHRDGIKSLSEVSLCEN